MTMLELHVGETETCLRGGRDKRVTRAAGRPDEALTACLSAAGVRRRGWLRRGVVIHLSTSLARPFAAGPMQGLVTWKEAIAFAAAAAPAATGVEGPCDVALEDWPGAGPVLATAVAQACLQRLASAVRDLGCRLISVRPAWALPLNRLIEGADGRPSPALIEDDDGAVVFSAPRGAVDVAMSMHPRPDTDSLATCLARLALSHDGLDKPPVRWAWSAADFGGAGRGWSEAAA